MTYGELVKMVNSCGMPSHDKVYVIDPKNRRRYVIKGMTTYGTDSNPERFGIIELLEDKNEESSKNNPESI